MIPSHGNERPQPWGYVGELRLISGSKPDSWLRREIDQLPQKIMGVLDTLSAELERRETVRALRCYAISRRAPSCPHERECEACAIKVQDRVDRSKADLGESDEEVEHLIEELMVLQLKVDSLS